MLPDDWEVASFDDVFKRLNAKSYQVQSSSYQRSGSLPVVDQGQKPVVGFSDQEDRRFPCPEAGVIVFGDHTCIVKYVDFDFVVGADGTQLLAARPEQSVRFHAYALEHRGVVSTGYNRHFKFLKERLFECPPLREQNAIASAVSDADTLLAKLDKVIAKKRDLKQAAKWQLLTGTTRLPGFGQHWEVKQLGDVATLQRGYDLPGRVRREGPVPIITSSGFGGTHSEARVRGPGVVTGRYGTIGEVFVVSQDFWPLNTTLYVRDFHGNDVLFVAHLLRTIDFHTHSGKSGVPGVNRNDLHQLEVNLPPIAEQSAIAAILADIDSECTALEARRDKTRALKQGMMQVLLTGRIRLV